MGSIVASHLTRMPCMAWLHSSFARSVSDGASASHNLRHWVRPSLLFCRLVTEFVNLFSNDPRFLWMVTPTTLSAQMLTGFLPPCKMALCFAVSMSRCRALLMVIWGSSGLGVVAGGVSSGSGRVVLVEFAVLLVLLKWLRTVPTSLGPVEGAVMVVTVPNTTTPTIMAAMMLTVVTSCFLVGPHPPLFVFFLSLSFVGADRISIFIAKVTGSFLDGFSNVTDFVGRWVLTGLVTTFAVFLFWPGVLLGRFI